MLKPLPDGGNGRNREEVRPRPGLFGEDQAIRIGQPKRRGGSLHGLGGQVEDVGVPAQGGQQVGGENESKGHA